MKMHSAPSSSQYQFSRVPRADIQRSVFVREWNRKQSMGASYLYPILCDEVLPGDSWNLKGTIFVQMQPLVQSLKDNLWLDTFYFFIPNRLVWEHWVNMMGERPDPDSSIDYDVPQMVAPAVTGFIAKSLSDYLELPCGVPGISVSALWHRAYNLVYREWFRPQQLIDSPVVDTDDGTSAVADYPLLKRCKIHDYFTSCLVAPQLGTGVDLPLGDTAPIIGLAKSNRSWNVNAATGYETANPVAVTYQPYQVIHDTADSLFIVDSEDDGSGNQIPAIYADLSTATASTINSLREAFQIQKLLERDSRSGTRYVEMLRAHYGVSNGDLRLMRPEFLGSNSTLINITPVAQTSATSGGSAQARLSAIAVGISHGEGFTKSFTEHGMILGLAQIRGAVTYQQGIPRMFRRLTRYDFYHPVLAHLGEQAVYNAEIFAQNPTVLGSDGVTPENEEAFGYQERWAELKYKPSAVCGEMRSTYSTPLDSWHLAEEFADLPVLGQTFIEDATPVSRVVAVTDQDPFFVDILFRCVTARAMPMNCTPGLIDHF